MAARLFEQSQQALARADVERRARDEFVSVVSHELRTPLNAILGWSRLLLAGGLVPAKQNQALQIIERNAVLQTRLVTDLLDMSAVSIGKIRIRLLEVDLAAVVSRAIAAIEPTAAAKVIEVETTLVPAYVRGDSVRLEQVVWLVLSNAVKFSTRQSRISVRLTVDPSDVELVVEDWGIGIDSQFLPFVFESFRQYDASSTRSHGGLGIGLSIAKHLVELHGGSIEVRSEGLGKGSSFVIRLPAISPSSRPSAPSAGERGRGISVLVVDPDFETRELTMEILIECGIEVLTAEDAGAALHLLGVAKPDVLVADVAMPVLDGFAFIRSLRASDASYKDIPAVALTTMIDRHAGTRAIEAGFQRHVVKPVDPEALIKAVLELVRARSSAPAAP